MFWKAVDKCKAHDIVISPAASCFIQWLKKKKKKTCDHFPLQKWNKHVFFLPSSLYTFLHKWSINLLGSCQGLASIWRKMPHIVNGLLKINPPSQPVAVQLSHSFHLADRAAMAPPALLFKAYSEYKFSLIGKEKQLCEQRLCIITIIISLCVLLISRWVFCAA